MFIFDILSELLDYWLIKVITIFFQHSESISIICYEIVTEIAQSAEYIFSLR